MRRESEEKKLAVIILNWQGKHLLEKFLPSVCKHTEGPGVKVIVADNGSDDGSCEFVKSFYPQVELISFDKNHGFAKGYNLAIEQAGYEYTILLNSDVEVTKRWWQPLLEYMENNPSVGAVQPKIKSFDKKDFFEYAGAAGGFLDKLGYPYCRGRMLDKVEKDEGQYDGEPIETDWASGACLMVRTKEYLKTGGLDANFFAHMEEIDLCWRLRSRNMKIMCVPQSEVYHVGGASLAMGNPKKTYLNFRNNLLMLYKNLPKGKRGRRIFLRMTVDALAFFMFLAKGEFKNGQALLKAHRDFHRMKKKYKEEHETYAPITVSKNPRSVLKESVKSLK